MGSDGVVVVAPLLDEGPGFLEATEDFSIEQFVPQLAVEAFAIAVLPTASQSICGSPRPSPWYYII
ncbi:MAG: hypothetical protein RL274_2755 [Pseudomonadota bacterium]|jgi:hypothetical protein